MTNANGVVFVQNTSNKTLALTYEQQRLFDLGYAAMAPNSRRAFLSDLKKYQLYCLNKKLNPFPANIDTLLEYIDFLVSEGLKANSIGRALSSLSTAHSLLELSNYVPSKEIKLKLKAVRRTLGGRPKQAMPIRLTGTFEGTIKALSLNKILQAQGKTLTDIRNKALLSISYDGLLRRSELVSIDIDNISLENSTPLLFIQSSKTDQRGQGVYIPLSSVSYEYYSKYIEISGLATGALFRKHSKSQQPLNRLNANSVNIIFKQMALNAGYSAMEIADLSGHSNRVGHAQDLANSGASTPQIAQSGRWRNMLSVMRYAERIDASQNASAQFLKTHRA